MPFDSANKKKIFNDPVYGFVSIPDELHFDLIEHPYFQRLRRIKQLGLTHLVYPGALHTRFHHSLGAMHLMQQAIQLLRNKGYAISDNEKQAASIAILLHDIGHGPYSHTLEKTIIEGVNHENLSRIFIQQLNKQLSGALDEAQAIFEGKHPRMFLSKLVSSQLDMDRMDYLKRDSFFTGVTEGNINADRLLAMLEVMNDELAIQAKGIYSIEKFIVARRLMYWQVYLHKTVLSAEHMLMNALLRAREISDSLKTATPEPLYYFLPRQTKPQDFARTDETIYQYSLLDDFDVFSALKSWSRHPDKVLGLLSNGIVNRKLFRVVMAERPFEEEQLQQLRKTICKQYGITHEEAGYLLIIGKTSNHAYHPQQSRINILFKDGSIKDISEASDQLNISVLSHPVSKYFLCFPKDVPLGIF
ncbi:MAG: HD domain-containing protein [Bacteroidales bacterium]|jgi:HD superfamily phosphohydrolase|nr:HD domain-containing protein [Bacteroidales bacterium]